MRSDKRAVKSALIFIHLLNAPCGILASLPAHLSHCIISLIRFGIHRR